MSRKGERSNETLAKQKSRREKNIQCPKQDIVLMKYVDKMSELKADLYESVF